MYPWKCVFMCICFMVFIYGISLMYKHLLELIKRILKVQEKNISCERALNFDQWKIFSESYKPLTVCLQIYREWMSLATFLRVHSNSKEVSFLPWQNKYPSLKTTCHIMPIFFLWTKLPKKLLLAKYLISAVAVLTFQKISWPWCITLKNKVLSSMQLFVTADGRCSSHQAWYQHNTPLSPI